MRVAAAKRESTADVIVAAATQCWAADPSATLDDVATIAGVGRATLHRHFPGGRIDLLHACATEGIRALDEALTAAEVDAAPPATAIDLLIDVLVQSGHRLHFLLVVDLSQDDDIERAEQQINARIQAILDRATTQGLLRRDVSRVWRFRVLEALVYAGWTAIANGEIAPLDAPVLVRDSLYRGFGT
ncbi:MAG: TetR/AcrR family transcriptional regulator [Gemmatimonadaceae bacterium]|nr:TetR/AcrR family transcriptional regulator [Gemmatimonadaceae bacterium]